MTEFLRQFGIYHLRWQAGGPILLLGLSFLPQDMNNVLKTLIINFVGACVFFWIDKFIFKQKQGD